MLNDIDSILYLREAQTTGDAPPSECCWSAIIVWKNKIIDPVTLTFDFSTAKPHASFPGDNLVIPYSLPCLNTVGSFVFIARQHLAADARYWYSNSVRPSVRPSVCPSVCLSVRDTLVLYENGLTNRHSFFSSYGSPIISVLRASNTFCGAKWLLLLGAL